MSGETIELQIQDYLDDRMSAEDRRAFEVRLARDDVLADRVRDYLDQRNALRDETTELTPAFYTRLRTRFDERQQRRTGGLRFVSWESAGLVTAAMLVGVVFVPYLLERGSESTLRPEQGKSERVESKDEAQRDEESGEKVARTEVFADELEAGEPLAESAETAAPAPAASAPASGKKKDEPVRRESLGRLDSNKGLAAAELDDDRARASATRAGAKSSVVGRALPDGVVGVAEWVEVVDRSEWNRLAERLPELIGPYDPSQRLILVGGDGLPLDCSRARVSRRVDAWEVRFFAPAPGTASSPACLFVLPRDAKPVRVTGSGSDR